MCAHPTFTLILFSHLLSSLLPPPLSLFPTGKKKPNKLDLNAALHWALRENGKGKNRAEVLKGKPKTFQHLVGLLKMSKRDFYRDREWQEKGKGFKLTRGRVRWDFRKKSFPYPLKTNPRIEFMWTIHLRLSYSHDQGVFMVLSHINIWMNTRISVYLNTWNSKRSQRYKANYPKNPWELRGGQTRPIFQEVFLILAYFIVLESKNLTKKNEEFLEENAFLV